MKFLTDVKNKSKEIAILYAIIFIPMWCMFFVNTFLMNDALNGIGGIHPRDFSIMGFLEIFTSWMFHSGGNRASETNSIFSHIAGNSEVLLPLVLFVGIFEKRPLLLVGSLIAASGFATWLLGAPNSVHVGASGLVFSMFGYIVASIFFARRWLYLIPVFGFGGTYIYSIKAGLIPHAGTSFAAHFGGLLGGILVAYLIGKIQKINSQLPQRSTFYTTSKSDFFFQKVKGFFKRKLKK
jgi:membrane associated rhomboid family serine protease